MINFLKYTVPHLGTRLRKHATLFQEDEMQNFFPLRGANRLFLGSLVILLICVANSFSQTRETVTRRAGAGLITASFSTIPEASEPCTPAECDWWERIRIAGNDLLRKPDKKTVWKYVELFVEGIENSHKIPLADRSPLKLFSTPPSSPPNNKRPRNGKVELLVEVLSDGSVGEVKVIKSLRSDMDKRCIQMQRNNIYLPAVKDRAFVAARQEAQCTFWSHKGL